ncbi:hypothetical protein GX441_01620 [bacterium]|nr:hypothetical protein [bacterium]
MDEEKKTSLDEPLEVRYDSSGKKIVAQTRDKDREGAILAINDKLDQLLGILTSTLPTRIGMELREAAGGQGSAPTADMQRLIEIVSKELPDRIQDDADKNTFQKAEMLSMVISTSFQYLQDAIKAYQESLGKTIEKIAELEEKTVQTLEQNASLLKELHALVAGLDKTPGLPQETTEKPYSFAKEETLTQPKTETSPPASPFSSPASAEPKKEEPQEKTDLPGWLQSKRDELGWPRQSDEPKQTEN